MYNHRKNYGIAPHTLGGLIEDVFQNGWNQVLNNDHVFQGNVPVNIQETDKAYELQVVAPGLKKEDFKVNVDKNLLHISFEQKEENKEQKPEGKWLRNEYRFRSFKRSFTLNEKINTAAVSARYADGILYVSLQKKELTEQPTQEIAVA